jgi:hypothetical protein
MKSGGIAGIGSCASFDRFERDGRNPAAGEEVEQGKSDCGLPDSRIGSGDEEATGRRGGLKGRGGKGARLARGFPSLRRFDPWKGKDGLGQVGKVRFRMKSREGETKARGSLADCGGADRLDEQAAGAQMLRGAEGGLVGAKYDRNNGRRKGIGGQGEARPEGLNIGGEPRAERFALGRPNNCQGPEGSGGDGRRERGCEYE